MINLMITNMTIMFLKKTSIMNHNSSSTKKKKRERKKFKMSITSMRFAIKKLKVTIKKMKKCQNNQEFLGVFKDLNLKI